MAVGALKRTVKSANAKVSENPLFKTTSLNVWVDDNRGVAG
jgi:hypothetical protein